MPPGRRLLKWAILFHDIGIPSTQTAAAAETINFYSHAFKKCRHGPKNLSTPEIFQSADGPHWIYYRKSLAAFFLFRAQQKKMPFQKEFIRFFMKCRDLTPDVLLHALAAFMGKKNTQDPGLEEFTDFIRSLIRNYYSDFTAPGIRCRRL